MLTVNECFSGIGSQSAALERLGVDFKVVGIAEIDKDAILSYAAIHRNLSNELKSYVFPNGKEMADYLKERNIGYDFKKNKPFSWQKLIDKITGKGKKDLKKYYLASILSNNYGDISKINKLDYADFWTYSFPYQDISVAGKQAGINKTTRSGLLYQVERLLEVAKDHEELPKYLMLENVKNLVGKQFKPQFDEWLQKLDQLGYNTYWQVLNAKNYGIPQNRERVFAISIRKDIDNGYVFPEPFDNGKRLKDILEVEVDEKFYLSDEKVKLFIKQGNVNPSGNGMNGNVCTSDICNTLTTNKGEGLKIGIDKSINNPKAIEYANCLTAREDRGISNHQSEGTAILESNIKQIGLLEGTNFNQSKVVYDIKGVAPTLRTFQGGGLEPKILIPQATKQGYIECNVPGVADLSFPDSKTRRGRVQDGGETCPTITCGSQDLCYIDEPHIIIGGMQKHQSVKTDGISTCLSASMGMGGGYVPMHNYTTDFRIRKLTPLECWRLMGFTDEQFYKAAEVNSNSQLYKQAGNSIVVDVLYYIFKNLFIDKPINKKIELASLDQQMSLSDFIGG